MSINRLILGLIISVLVGGIVAGVIIGEYIQAENTGRLMNQSANSDLHIIRHGDNYYFINPFTLETCAKNQTCINEIIK
jgi:predicted histidine transporter YuiF (NhaC family)